MRLCCSLSVLNMLIHVEHSPPPATPKKSKKSARKSEPSPVATPLLLQPTGDGVMNKISASVLKGMDLLLATVGVTSIFLGASSDLAITLDMDVASEAPSSPSAQT